MADPLRRSFFGRGAPYGAKTVRHAYMVGVVGGAFGGAFLGVLMVTGRGEPRG